MSTPREFPLVQPTTVSGLSREDVAVVAAAHARVAARNSFLTKVVVIGGLAVGVGLLVLRQAASWPGTLDPFLFAAGWAIALSGAVIGHRRAIRDLSKYQLVCPGCHAALLDSGAWRSSTWRVDRVLHSGHCPSCGASLFEGGLERGDDGKEGEGENSRHDHLVHAEHTGRKPHRGDG